MLMHAETLTLIDWAEAQHPVGTALSRCKS